MLSDVPRRGLAEPEAYRGPTWWPLARLTDAPSSPGARRIAAVWLASIVLCTITGILNAAFDWNGIVVEVFGLRMDLTIYPPFLISVLAAVWIGPVWGVIPAYIANVASALWGGLPVPLALLFALGGAIETAIVWGSMFTLDIGPELRRRRDVVLFVVVSLAAPVISSLSVVIWNSARGLDFVAGQRAWRGWVVGDFLQLTLLGLPLLRYAGPAVRTWIDRQFQSPPLSDVAIGRRTAMAHTILATMGVLVYVGISMLKRSLGIDPQTRTVSGEPLAPRLFEIQFFLGLLALTVFMTTAAFAAALARASERNRAEARRESLTGCFNRRAFYELFDREADRSRRLGQGLSLVFLDLDHFKAINDRFGHEAGDRVLQQLAMRLQGVVRETDLVFRWGGEEFVVLLPHSGPGDAHALAERLRIAVAERPFLGTQAHPPVDVTVSLGTAGTIEFPADANRLVGLADAACYRAKSGGRNRVEHARAREPAVAALDSGASVAAN
jgi:diguanylate cyclase (GGDEF)-like protein